MVTTTIDNIFEGFPYPIITKIEWQPTHKTVEELDSQLNANGASVQSDLGGGRHDYLVLTMLPAILNTLSTAPFGITNNPVHQTVIDTGSTAPQIASIRLDHKNALERFVKYDNTDKALKQQLVGL